MYEFVDKYDTKHKNQRISLVKMIIILINTIFLNIFRLLDYRISYIIICSIF